MSDLECTLCKIDLFKQYHESYALPIKKCYKPHCYKCGYEITVRKKEELEAHVENLQKLLGKYASHVEECEGVDFLPPDYGRNELLTLSESEYIRKCKLEVLKNNPYGEKI
tara:strand:+ start:146 stop:478 length:333 start_codon:yes stop_codon:yes gene_type:complete